MYEILGNVLDIGQCMGYLEIYQTLSNLWDIVHSIGNWGMNRILGTLDTRNWTMYRILGNVWYVGQCLGNWEMYRILGNVIYIQQCMGYWAMYGILSLYLDERRGVQGNTSPRELPRPNAGIFCTPRLESRYRHYPIYKSDEAVAIAIAIAIASA